MKKSAWVIFYTKSEPEELSGGGGFSDGGQLSDFMDLFEDCECWNNWNSFEIKPNRDLCRFMIIDEETFEKEIGDICTTQTVLENWLRTHREEEMSYEEAFNRLEALNHD